MPTYAIDSIIWFLVRYEANNCITQTIIKKLIIFITLRLTNWEKLLVAYWGISRSKEKALTIVTITTYIIQYFNEPKFEEFKLRLKK